MLLIARDTCLGQPAVKPLLSFGDDTKPVAVAFSPDGKTLATGGRDHAVTLWDVATGKKLASLGKHLGTVFDLAFTDDGKTLISVSGVEWDPEVGPEKLILEGKYLGEVIFWDVASGKRRVRRENSTGPVLCLALSPDSKTVATGWGPPGPGAAIKLWNTVTGEEVHSLEGHKGQLRNLAFSLDGETLASGSLDRTVRLWDLRQRRERLNLPVYCGGRLIFSPNGKVLAIMTVEWTPDSWALKLCDATSGKVLRETKEVTGSGGMKLVPGTNVLAIAGKIDHLSFLDMTTAKKLAGFSAHKPIIYYCAVSPDGKKVATTGMDGLIKIWDIPKVSSEVP